MLYSNFGYGKPDSEYLLGQPATDVTRDYSSSSLLFFILSAELFLISLEIGNLLRSWLQSMANLWEWFLARKGVLFPIFMLPSIRSNLNQVPFHTLSSLNSEVPPPFFLSSFDNQWWPLFGLPKKSVFQVKGTELVFIIRNMYVPKLFKIQPKTKQLQWCLRIERKSTSFLHFDVFTKKRNCAIEIYNSVL